jgi:hypothetical protein
MSPSSVRRPLISKLRIFLKPPETKWKRALNSEKTPWKFLICIEACYGNFRRQFSRIPVRLVRIVSSHARDGFTACDGKTSLEEAWQSCDGTSIAESEFQHSAQPKSVTESRGHGERRLAGPYDFLGGLRRLIANDAMSHSSPSSRLGTR